MKTYTVRIACEVAGVWREKDEPFSLTDEQAQHLAPPFGNVVIPATSAAEVAASKPDKPSRG